MQKVKPGDGFSKMEKMNAELLSVTYGTLVMQLIKDLPTLEAVNSKLEEMGYSMGLRMVDEFFAKSGEGACQSIEEIADVICKKGFKMYLGFEADVRDWSENKLAFSIIFSINPFAEFVELGEGFGALSYSNIISGIIRGVMKTLNILCKCSFRKDMLKEHAINEIRVEIEEILQDKYVHEA